LGASAFSRHALPPGGRRDHSAKFGRSNLTKIFSMICRAEVIWLES